MNLWNATGYYAEDLAGIANCDFIPWEMLRGKSVLVTGGTGLIGSNLINALLYTEKEKKLGLRVFALVRDEAKAARLFEGPLAEKLPLSFIIGSVETPLSCEENFSYIIHTASPTSSKYFVEHPVETISTAVSGTENMLKLAAACGTEGFLYLSSMEVYGTPQTDEPITESHGTDLNTTVVRSCYPEGKRMCEMLCTAYAAQYHVPAKIVRLTQTFGPGVKYHDGRVFAEFARCAMEKRNIILHTEGKTRRNYLYTADAVAAILTVLLKGEAGQAYNAANESTYCSIYEMAELVAHECAQDQISIEIQLESEEKYGYAPVLHMNLQAAKLRALGWAPVCTLPRAFKSIMSYMEE